MVLMITMIMIIMMGIIIMVMTMVVMVTRRTVMMIIMVITKQRRHNYTPNRYRNQNSSIHATTPLIARIMPMAKKGRLWE